MHNDNELEHYGDSGIASADAKVPRWLIFWYVVLPIWGIISFCLYWNGVGPWFDRGAWLQLERAANTTYPPVNYLEPKNNP